MSRDISSWHPLINRLPYTPRIPRMYLRRLRSNIEAVINAVYAVSVNAALMPCYSMPCLLCILCMCRAEVDHPKQMLRCDDPC